jgi:flagellar M-ring protein FliF
MAGIAALVAVMAGMWMWSQKPDYGVLFSNFSDKDGGAIVASLQQMNVPYKLADGGGAILVPTAQVHETRLRLASQGLPKGSGVGFELMENQKLGVSQFLEQVNFQRALEGEMARSIQSIGAVQSARVHLALHKDSVFVRDQKKPTASVLLNLHPGRSLDEAQVSAIIHLVASSVPSLVASNITVVDQSGNLLSASDKPVGINGLDPAQIKYVQELQKNIVKRIESIISPIVGANNVRAEATADVDFSRSEQAAETYKPNQTPNPPSVRSQQSSESQTLQSNTASGVPGALSNQPPAPATAPINAPGKTAAPAVPPPTPINTHKDTTVNYEIDKTIRYTQQPMGGVKRLSVAVVVNYKKETDQDGKVTTKPLTDADKEQITNLVKEAMGYNKERGDTLNVVNSPFADDKEAIVELPLWKRPETLAMSKEVGKYLAIGAVLLYLFFAFLRPLLRKLSSTINPPPVLPAATEEEQEGVIVELSGEEEKPKVRGYQENLDAAKLLARQDPRVVANVVKNWVGVNE